MRENRIELERIDDICTSFEEVWNPDLPWQSLPEYVARYETAGTREFAELLAEMAQIDLERRWRFLAQISADAQQIETSAGFAARNKIPRCQDYLALFTDECQAISIRRTLEDCELRSRLKYGDVPIPGRVVTDFAPTSRYERYMPTVSVFFSGRNRFTAPFCGTLLVGRQDVEEPDPPVMIAQTHGSKLICAPLEDKSISRLQFTVTVIAGNSTRIANSSSNTFFCIGESLFLKPGESQIVQFPVEVKLGTTIIRLRRPLLEVTGQRERGGSCK